MKQMTVNLDHRRLLSAPEAAFALGISKQHLANLRKKLALPFVTLGNSIRYDTADLLTWIAANKCLPQPSAC